MRRISVVNFDDTADLTNRRRELGLFHTAATCSYLCFTGDARCAMFWNGLHAAAMLRHKLVMRFATISGCVQLSKKFTLFDTECKKVLGSLLLVVRCDYLLLTTVLIISTLLRSMVEVLGLMFIKLATNKSTFWASDLLSRNPTLRC